MTKYNKKYQICFFCDFHNNLAYVLVPSRGIHRYTITQWIFLFILVGNKTTALYIHIFIFFLFCSNFMDVVESFMSPSDTEAKNVKLYALACSGLKLRNACSVMNRVTDIDQKGHWWLREVLSGVFFAVHCFLPVSPLACGQWVNVSHIIPCPCSVHLGVAGDIMQGREVKHQKLANYTEFSLPKERWKVFLHEHISLILLRHQNLQLVKYSKSKLQYILKRCYTREFGFCGLLHVHPDLSFSKPSTETQQ